MKVWGIVGWKNSGKTGLITRLVAAFTAMGFSVSTLKHAHHSFDVDHDGKDSQRHREAGARQVMLSSRRRWALMSELRTDPEAAFDALLARMDPVDIVLVEGWKAGPHPKIEARRAPAPQPPLASADPGIRAVAAKGAVDVACPVFDLDDTAAIAAFILDRLGLTPAGDTTVPSAGPDKLADDCFALPPGVDWTPVDAALDRLRAALSPVVGRETLPLRAAAGRRLAGPVAALRDNPPAANSAVDGWGFAFAGLGAAPHDLPILSGRSAPGEPFAGTVPPGMALRILTGALLPAGVDCVVLDEDVTLAGDRVRFAGGVRPGANTRKAGEDVRAGAPLFAPGTRLGPAELALAAATGHPTLPVHRRLRVAVLSTGSELAEPDPALDARTTFDANRPMLLTLLDRWGHDAVDLGQVGDDAQAVQARLDAAADAADVVLTSGGASAGDEDHVSALLRAKGRVESWRIALKPGRPLALGFWRDCPVIGLPGNPVAAMVCSLIFARPALELMAGGHWVAPQGFDLPAAFEKRKKPGRREYLRARLTAAGQVEPFRSEGSGRISGLSWADGLVELGDGARHIRPGDPVRYIPYASFGL